MSINNKQQSGSTLLEVLIAVLVLSIGLLGVASLQLYGLRYNQSAYLRSQATILAYDIIDRMRSNTDAVTAGSYDNIDTNTLPTDPACISVGCTTVQLADHDIREWGSYFTQAPPLVPDGRGTVTRAGSRFTVTVQWNETTSTTNTSQQVSYNFQL